MAVGEYIGNGCPDGSSFGSSTSELISFYGVTPVSQRAGAAQAAVAVSTITTAATTTTPWGFATSTQADAVAATVASLVTLANELRAGLVALGAVKGAA